MGRQERRLLERKNRLEDRKTKILMRPEDIKEMKAKLTESITERFGCYSTETLFTCFALANHRLYGHGWQRTMRTLSYVDELMGPIVDGTKTVEDYKKELKDEVGFVVDTGLNDFFGGGFNE